MALTLCEGWWPGGSNAAPGCLQQPLQLVTACSLLLNQVAVHHQPSGYTVPQLHSAATTPDPSMDHCVHGA